MNGAILAGVSEEQEELLTRSAQRITKERKEKGEELNKKRRLQNKPSLA